MNTEKIRRPAVAGQFYEGNPASLKRDVEKLLASAEISAPPSPGMTVQAVIVPHAGYVFSGATAAKTFAAAKKHASKYERALILAPSHGVPFSGIGCCSYTAYGTPLGNIPVDADATAKITGHSCQWIESIDVAHKSEHSLEVELPFLATLFPGLPIIPLICGHVDKQIAECIGKILLQFFGPSTLWVISSDFTHFGYSFGYVPFKTDVPENLRKLDLGAVEKISALDFDGFSKYVESTGATICGANPIRILLKTANLAAAKGAELKASLIEYTTSGESTGDWSHCVSYAGIAVYRR